MRRQCIGIIANESAEMLIGLLGILKSGNCFVPLNPLYPGNRLNYIIRDCGITVLLTDSFYYEQARQLAGDNPCIRHVLCIGDLVHQAKKKQLPRHLNESKRPRPGCPAINPDQTCYIIYTSGSTGKPKGVPISHGNLTPLLLWFRDYFNLGENIKVLQTLSYAFDFGIFEVFSTVIFGGTIYFPGLETLNDLPGYVDFINKYGINTIHTTPSFFSNIISHGQSMPTLEKLHFGGEELTVKMVEEVIPLLADDCTIYNGYGPTEATINASIFSITGVVPRWVDAMGSIPIGWPSASNMIYILNQQRNLLPVGIAGEICIGGRGVAPGYLNRPQLTAEQFIPNPFTAQITVTSSPVSHRLYCTGDLGRLLNRGQIQYLGRIDHQVKIRGFRIELGEIETCMLEHPGINKAVVLAREDHIGNQCLCAYFVPGKETSISETRQYLSRNLPGYMVPSYLMRVEKIPLTPTGKIDRKALPEPGIEIDTSYVSPSNSIEKKLVRLWSELLGMEQEKISIDANFFALGGHSLKAMAMISQIHKALDVKIPLTEVFHTPSIRGLSKYIQAVKKNKYTWIVPLEKKEYYALSSAQKRLYILQQMELDSKAYNIPNVISWTGELEIEVLEKIFIQLIKRHESFRTAFHLLEEPVQRVQEGINFKIEYDDISNVEAEIKVKEERQKTDDRGNPTGDRQQTIEDKPATHVSSSSVIRYLSSEFVRPFDLSLVPLLRVGLIKEKTGSSILMVDMHHIISDGISHEILIQEFMALYQEQMLPHLRIQYKDFSHWQNSIPRKALEKQETYWLGEFAGSIPRLDLPGDYVRPVIQSFAGNHCNFELSVDNTKTLAAIALREGATLYMVLLAFFNILFAKLTHQEDIIIGTPIAGRRHVDLDKIIGMFVNTLALRNYPKAEKSLREFLQEVKERTLEAFENQEYAFEDLVEKVNVSRDASRNPMFDVMFTLENYPGEERQNNPSINSQQNQLLYENSTAKFDLTVIAVQRGEKLLFIFQYCRKLFKKQSIERFFHCFKQLISSAAREPGMKLGQIEIIPGVEKKQILHDFNNIGRKYSCNKTLHQLLEEQVEVSPHQIVLVGQHWKSEIQNSRQERTRELAPWSDLISITYRELNQKSQQLAYLLKGKGIQPDTIVAFMVERSIEMIVGLLGILKAGGAYLPIDPDYPRERIAYMLADSSVEVLLTTPKLRVKVKAEVEERMIEIIDISNLSSFTTLTSTCRARSSYKVSPPGTLAYIIYTSGSTGNPKGVPITHANVCPLLYWGHKYLGLNPGERVIQNLSYFFDWSVWEIFITLTSGASLYLAHREILFNPEWCIHFIYKHEISVFHITPTHFFSFIHVGQKLETLKYLCLGAEQLTLDLVKHCQALLNKDCRVFNMYGPTEAAIIASVLDIDLFNHEKYEYLSGIPIGKPIANTYLLILDLNLNMCPVHVKGELYIAGDGLAAGYLNDVERTSKSFIKNSFESESIRGERLYKTGDLVRWLHNGTIEFLGRIDYQVKIRGFRIELGEIETQLVKYPGIKEAIVLTTSNESGEKYLCAYIVGNTSEEEPVTAELREYLSGKLPDYMIPTYFVFLENIPLTPNGKADRKALPAPGAKAEDRYMAPRNQVEEKLTELWAQVLGTGKKTIGIDSNFFNLGGHSLKATLLTARIHRSLNVRVPLGELFRAATIRGLAEYITTAGGSPYQPILPAEEQEYYEVSHSQLRVWTQSQVEAASISFNMPMAQLLQGNLKIPTLEQTFKILVNRHESLRTVFFPLEEEIKQKILKPEETGFKVEYINLAGELAKETKVREVVERESVKPFDLSIGPLLRVTLIGLEVEKHVLFINMHHIISDYLSYDIFFNETLSLYEAFEKNKHFLLKPLKIQYKDYTLWYIDQLKGGRLNHYRKYWMRLLKDELPRLELPLDKTRPPVNTYSGDAVESPIEAGFLATLKAFSETHGITLFNTLFTALNLLFYYYTGERDIVLGMVTAGRDHADLEDQVGYYLNTLVLRTRFHPGDTFTRVLEKVKVVLKEAYQHQAYPFDLLVEEFGRHRHGVRHPFFDVLVDMLNLTHPYDKGLNPNTNNTVRVDNFPIQASTAKFDLVIYFIEGEHTMVIRFEYNKDLFERATIERMANRFRKLLETVMADPGSVISALKLEQKPRPPLIEPLARNPRHGPQDLVRTTIPQEIEKPGGRY